jgi:hypothetical protein
MIGPEGYPTARSLSPGPVTGVPAQPTGTPHPPDAVELRVFRGDHLSDLIAVSGAAAPETAIKYSTAMLITGH